MFNILRRKDFITERLLKYFAYEYKKATNLGKLGKFCLLTSISDFLRSRENL